MQRKSTHKIKKKPIEIMVEIYENDLIRDTMKIHIYLYNSIGKHVQNKIRKSNGQFK